MIEDGLKSVNYTFQVVGCQTFELNSVSCCSTHLLSNNNYLKWTLDYQAWKEEGRRRHERPSNVSIDMETDHWEK